jgi:hypothetical protein
LSVLPAFVWANIVVVAIHSATVKAIIFFIVLFFDLMPKIGIGFSKLNDKRQVDN